MHNFETRFTDVCWPAIPQPHSAAQLAVLFELNESQWQAPDQIEAWQFRQLEHVVRHAHKEVPFYRKCFDALNLDPRGAISRDQWRVLPLLTRRDLQLSGSELHSRSVPDGHGPVTSAATSGSTNAPVTTLGTSVTEFFWRVLTLREHFWHRRDFSQRFAAIRYSKDQRAQPPDGQVSDNWGAATAGVIKTGPAFLLDIRSTVEEQASWLLRVDPAYVLGYPSALLGIARLFEQQGHQLQQLREVRTFGEILEPECRAVCQRAFGVKIVDMYSSQEVGYIALQCPEHEHYHVQSENVLVEVVDQAGKPCMTGEVGKVVVTTLHNFAMPLLRYDIGDYAEVGAPCPCGRGLPVLKRILGRQRNLLVLPTGQRRWPVFDAGERPEELPPFFQFQVIQRSLERIEVLAVRQQPFTEAEAEKVERYIRQTLGHPFSVVLRRVDSIPRSPTGKFEDFICEVS